MTHRHVENKVTKNVENEKNGKKCAGNKKNKSEIKKKENYAHTAAPVTDRKREKLEWNMDKTTASTAVAVAALPNFRSLYVCVCV